MTADSARERLGNTFDQAAGCYQRARPDYPSELFDDLITVARPVSGERLLEVGCATGKATLPLARRGFHITCIESGPHLAAAARRNLAGLDVDIIEGPVRGLAATPGRPVWPGLRRHHVELGRSRRRLWPGLAGAVAGRAPGLLERRPRLPRRRRPVLPPNPRRLRRDRRGPAAQHSLAPARRTAEATAEIESTGLFEVVHVRRFDWERTYDADSYIEPLSTFSGHIAMADWKRERLYSVIRARLGDRPERTVRRHWGAVLHIACRRD